MPIPKGGTGQVPIGQDNPPILSMTHSCTIRFPAQRVHLSSAPLCSPSPMEVFLEMPLGLGWLQRCSWAPPLLWERGSCHRTRGTPLPSAKRDGARGTGQIIYSGPKGQASLADHPATSTPWSLLTAMAAPYEGQAQLWGLLHRVRPQGHLQHSLKKCGALEQPH